MLELCVRIFLALKDRSEAGDWRWKGLQRLSVSDISEVSTRFSACCHYTSSRNAYCATLVWAAARTTLYFWIDALTAALLISLDTGGCQQSARVQLQDGRPRSPGGLGFYIQYSC
jgi:hypothetical protein